MARYKGIFKAAANYEPQIAAPFDARMLVDAKADLTDRSIWQQSNGDVWVYSGMIVAVANDENETLFCSWFIVSLCQFWFYISILATPSNLALL